MGIHKSTMVFLVTVVAWIVVTQTTLTTGHEIHVHLSDRCSDQVQLRYLTDLLNSSSSHDTAQMTQMRAELDTLKAQVARQQSLLDADRRHSAFFATFSGGELVTPSSGPFKFDHVTLNDGYDYDPLLGVYEAPYDGVYVLALQIYSLPKGQRGRTFDLVINGQTRNRMALARWSSAEPDDSMVSSAMVYQLKAGDKVWLQGVSGRAYTVWGLYHSFFSGALLYTQ